MPTAIPGPPPYATATLPGLVSIAAQTFAGDKTFTGKVIGTTICNTNGTGASDIAIKAGTTTADASVNATAKLLSLRTGIGGSEVEKFYVLKGGETRSGVGSGSNVAYGPSGDDNTGIWFPAGDTINLVTGGTLRLQVTATGASLFQGAISMPASTLFTIGNGFSTVYESASGVLTWAGRFSHAGTFKVGSALGAGSTDVGTVNGFDTADGSVHASAKLWSLRTGIGASEVEYVFARKGEFTFWGTGTTIVKWDGGGANHWEMRAAPGANWELGNNSITYMGCRISDGYCFSQYGFEMNPTGTQATVKTNSTGVRLDQRGLDRRATVGNDSPGNYAMGINTLASGATTCTITTTMATTASHVEITWLADPGARDWVTLASGSFTVNLSAAPGADKSFSWRISGLL